MSRETSDNSRASGWLRSHQGQEEPKRRQARPARGIGGTALVFSMLLITRRYPGQRGLCVLGRIRFARPGSTAASALRPVPCRTGADRVRRLDGRENLAVVRSRTHDAYRWFPELIERRNVFASNLSGGAADAVLALWLLLCDPSVEHDHVAHSKQICSND